MQVRNVFGVNEEDVKTERIERLLKENNNDVQKVIGIISEEK